MCALDYDATRNLPQNRQPGHALRNGCGLIARRNPARERAVLRRTWCLHGMGVGEFSSPFRDQERSALWLNTNARDAHPAEAAEMGNIKMNGHRLMASRCSTAI